MILIRLLFFLCPLMICAQGVIPITVEHAKTLKERQQGLMLRNHLKPNHGMLFHHPEKRRHSVWMYNCPIPLSIAFLDDSGKIQEIRELKAHPELVDASKDLPNLRSDDPTIRLFLSEAVTPRHAYRHALEMEGGWFQKNGVSRGDTIKWSEQTPQAAILKTSSP